MADHGTHHHDSESGELKSKTAFRSSFWFVLILVGLFIAALNFISVMSHDEGHGAAAHGQAQDHHNEAEVHHTKEATASGTLKGETGLGRDKEDTTQFHGAVNAHDTVTREGQN